MELVSPTIKNLTETLGDDFNSFKTFQKNTNVYAIIIVISYNWSKNIAEFPNVFSWTISQLRRFFSIQLLYIS